MPEPLLTTSNAATAAALRSRRHALAALTAALAALPAATVQAQAVPSPHAIDIPRWFANSLLDLEDEVAQAAREGKRVMVYFGQDGCPYCKALMKANFGPGAIADKTRKHFVAVAINIWGDLEVSWIDGRKASEKELARRLAVQFTPTLMFLETDGRVVLRLNGYLPPERFTHVLDYVIQRHDRELSLAAYMDGQLKEPELPLRGARPYLMRDASNLARAGRGRPLAVLFESASCKACVEMHAEAFARPALRTMLRGFDVARLVPGTPAKLVTPDGRWVEAAAWARDLQINLYPTVVFFDAQGREAFRFDGYLRPFHIESAFDYVASGAHAREPQFQRFVQARAERLQQQGRPVDLWR